ncbi:adhesion G-protein coupled receptor G6-like isoform X2 [Hydractinia symbiolongicarpus]|uniref:adhesion G-protein coupled receptor G6-like isoform X2 n=1 Tax=Hydractinia symbiolongicarpus TaxID=13093 RepID=UPI00254C4317|nr:adhesion G-protein coupled receptor G6-like isoform X2 [Hydractinia symbiolongicarpus]
MKLLLMLIISTKLALLESISTEITGNVCSRKFILLCWDGNLVKITPFKCSSNNESNNKCSALLAFHEFMIKTCDRKIQCRITRSAEIDDTCGMFNNSIVITYTCEAKNAWKSVLPTTSNLVVTSNTTTGKFALSNTTGIDFLGRSSSTETSSSTEANDEILINRIALAATTTTKTAKTTTTTTTEAMTAETTDSETMGAETTATETKALETIIPTTDTKTNLPIKKLSTQTEQNTTEASPVKSSRKTPTQTFLLTENSGTSTSMGITTDEKMTLQKASPAKTHVTKEHSLQIDEVPTLSTTRLCHYRNKTAKPDGNYTWPDHPKCFIQCSNGKQNWECCRPKSYFYVAKCKSCFREPNPRDCHKTRALTVQTKLESTPAPSVETDEPVIVKAEGYCEVQLVGDANSRGKYEFPKTKALEKVVRTCIYGGLHGKNNFERFCLYDKFKGAYWSKLDLSKCAPKDLDLNNLERITVNQSNILKVSSSLAKIASKKNRGPIKEKQIKMITGLISKMFKLIGSDEQVAGNILTVIDSLLQQQKELNSDSASVLLQQVNTLGSSFNLKKGQRFMVVAKKDITFGVTKVDKKEVKFSVSSETDMIGSFNNDKKNVESISVPSSAVKNIKEDTQAYFYVLRDQTLFHRNVDIQSSIISATIVGNKIKNLKEPVVIKLKRKGNGEGDISCRFWKIVNSSYATWSREGCYKASTSADGIVTCKCNHLTNFALLLDPLQQYENPTELRVYSFVGCLVSILGLGLTLITFVCFAKLRKKIPAKILICLCVSLMFLFIVFVAGINQTKHAALCHIIASLLHYFTLTSFSWMLVEALNLYRTIVKVFTRGNDARFFKWMCLYAWGIPLVIVGVTGYLTRANFRPGYHTQFCIVQGVAFYYTLLLPVCVVLVINCAIFVPVIKGITTGDKLLKDSIQDRQMINAKRAKSSFAVIIVLGLSWIFGVLAVGDLRDVFQWLFCILSSFQGFFIFLMFVVFNVEARKVWKGIFGGLTRQKKYTSSMKMLQRKNTKNEPSITINGEAYGYSDDHVFKSNDDDDDDDEYEDSDAV